MTIRSCLVLAFLGLFGLGCASTVSGAASPPSPRADASFVEVVASDAAIFDVPSADRGSGDAVQDAPPPDAAPALNATLRVSIAAADVPRRTVKNARAFSMRVVFTSSSGLSNNTVDEFTLSGVGNVMGVLRREDLRHVVLSCELRDGDLQVGSVEVPSDRSRMTFTGLGFTVPAGTSRGLNIFCRTDSIVAQAYDEFAIGIASEADIVWHPSDPRLGRVTYLDDALRNQTGERGAVPPVLIQVYPSGSLTIMPDTMRPSTIVVPGEYWEVMAQYRAVATLEDQEVDVVRVTAHGDSASFRRVAIAVDGRTLTSGILPAGRDQGVDLPLPLPLLVPADSSRVIQVWGELAPVVSYSTTMASEGVARSGALISLGFASGVRIGGWTGYDTAWNVRATGRVSRAPTYAEFGSRLLGNLFAVRRTVPGVQVIRPSPLTIPMAGESVELFRFQVTAHPVGALGFKSFRLITRILIAMGSTLSFDQIALYEGSRRMDPSEYEIISFRVPVTRFSMGTAEYTVIFRRERILEGSGQQYAIRARVQGTILSGDTVTTSFDRNYVPETVTGYLTGEGSVIHVGMGRTVASTFTWSDLSEVPHTDDLSRHDGSSRDWTTEHWLQDLTPSITLSAP